MKSTISERESTISEWENTISEWEARPGRAEDVSGPFTPQRNHPCPFQLYKIWIQASFGSFCLFSMFGALPGLKPGETLVCSLLVTASFTSTCFKQLDCRCWGISKEQLQRADQLGQSSEKCCRALLTPPSSSSGNRLGLGA